ncbi:MAG: (2R)-sulfolactate sulfo-lyase subunit beta [Spirochaetes bacterium ADurb.Bin315]|mgnify:FL=1|nr:UxaA family hydrolase [Spirochaetota bacterium]NLL24504.1 UxaA family hydrolase [Spirochaetales bacterium]OQA44237.1 MAG: (2R)-sulfolactate sulfo-lyase subunit beta [Spirochaetes bacterium ADurb.Bin315]TAH57099.1 MAG: galactonate dehydratase [Sphaerochaeta sp.]HOE88491.1 UxaA family hydrolase [Sphaerochaeta sp.]
MAEKQSGFFGYVRKDGSVGVRNYVAILPSVVCVNEVVEAIVANTVMTQGIIHHQGCCQTPPDLERTTECLIKIGENPNVGAVLIVSLGCEGVDTDRLEAALRRTGKPVDRINVQELGGTSRAIQAGLDKAQRLIRKIAGEQRVEVDMSHFTMGIKCGASDTTSGIASNPVIGYVADKVVDLGGTVIFGETTEFIGAEHILKRRAKNAEVAADIDRIVIEMENRAKAIGVDMRKGQPTPGNIKGGLSTIEEKSLGAIVKSGTKTIQGVIDYTEIPKGKGLWIKDSPGREIELMSGMAIGGAQIILFSTGRGAPQGFPVVPVIKICGNPITYERMIHDMDINAGLITTGERSLEEVGEEVFEMMLRVASGEVTKGEAIKYSKSMDFYMLGPVI